MQEGKIIENINPHTAHSGGKMMATFDEKNVFINNAIPSETLTICLQKRHKGFRLANIVEITKPSEHRVEPFCKHFGICGGCNWQHIAYNKQLELKRSILVNALNKYNITYPTIEGVIKSEKEKYFRNKTEYAFTQKYWVNNLHEVNATDNLRGLGFHPADRAIGVINIEECYLQGAPEAEIVTEIRNFAKLHNFEFYNFITKQGWLRNLVIRTTTLGQCMVIVGILFENMQNINLLLNNLLEKVNGITSINYTIIQNSEKGYSNGNIVNFGNTKAYITEQIGQLQFRIYPLSFFQPNTLQTVNFYNKIVEFGNFNGTEIVYDLYTGAGTIACFIANKVKQVIGIEGSAAAIKNANENALINNIYNTHFIVGDILETFTPHFITQHPQANVIILDPPRSGTLMEIKKTIIAANPQKIIYVSCNPVSLAWDLKLLTEKYKITAIQAFDQFPHTHHVETVVLLEKNVG